MSEHEPLAIGAWMVPLFARNAPFIYRYERGLAVRPFALVRVWPDNFVRIISAHKTRAEGERAAKAVQHPRGLYDLRVWHCSEQGVWPRDNP